MAQHGRVDDPSLDPWFDWLAQWERGARLVLGITAISSLLGTVLARWLATG